jgi:NAD(P)H-quinone oxidoreductase subunit J
VKYLYKEGEMKTMQQGWLSNWLVKHEVVHRSLGFDHRGIETLQIKAGDWDSIAVILYVYGYNYLRSQCAYDVAPGGSLASVYHLTRIQYGIDNPEEVCIKVFAQKDNPRIPSVFWIWRSADYQERGSQLNNLAEEPSGLETADATLAFRSFVLYSIFALALTSFGIRAFLFSTRS